MTDLSSLLRDEAEYAETHKDTPEQPETVTTRPGGRARVYSIRLSNDDIAALESAAERVGVPASTLARMWICERLTEDDGATDLQAIAQTLDVIAKRLAAV